MLLLAKNQKSDKKKWMKRAHQSLDQSSPQNAFDVQYKGLLEAVMNHGVDEVNQRTGHVCRSIPGMGMRFDLAEGFPLLALRKIPLKVFIAEQMWFLMGNKNLSFLQRFTKIWDDFAEENNCVESAYGYRWRKHFGRDQIGALVTMLQNDPTSRHGVVLMWDPSDDGLGGEGTAKKNVPCPYTFTVQIIGGRLCLHLMIRSNDLLLGNPHDVSGFALQAHFLAQKLNVEPGILTVSISNAHIYDIHFEQAQEIIDRDITHTPIKFVCPPNAFDRAEEGDESLVNDVFEAIKSHYNPQPALKRMAIVL